VRDEVLSAPFIDTRAADLVWSLDPRVPVPAPLATLPLRAPGVELDLHLLGASHRIEVRAPFPLVETVACLPGGSSGLPPHARHEADGLRYEFRTEISRPRAADFGTAVERLLADLPEDALVGRFAGERHALTALAASVAGPTAVAWRTWHVYPQTNEIVETRSEVLFRGASHGHVLADREGRSGPTPAGRRPGAGADTVGAGVDRLLVR
jgi:hypothetical protein